MAHPTPRRRAVNRWSGSRGNEARASSAHVRPAPTGAREWLRTTVPASEGPMTRIVIIGGGPAGYEAALVAAQLGADVTVVEKDGVGGASVLTDCVPSKTLIASAGAMSAVHDSAT